MRIRYSCRFLLLPLAVLAMALPGAAALAGTVTPATGGTAMPLSTATNACALPPGVDPWTPLAGPNYAETINNDLGNGIFTLTAPAGFEFDTASPVSIILTQGDGNANVNTNNTAVGGTVANAAVTATTISFMIFQKSQGNVLNTIQWRGIQVRPTSTSPLASGIITAGGTAVSLGMTGITATTSFGQLTEVGTATRLVVTMPGQTFSACNGSTGVPASQTAATPFDIAQVTAVDDYLNVITTYSGTRTLAYSGPGAGSGCINPPAYTTSVSFANGVSATTLSTTLRKAEPTSITVSDGTIASPASTPFTVNPGALSRLVVTLPGQTFTACAGNSGTVTDQATGVAFNIARITATDADFNIVTGYGGMRTLGYSGPAGTPSYTTSVSFNSGQSATALATTLTVAELTAITVTDGTVSGPGSSPLRVVLSVASFNAFDTGTATGSASGVLRTRVAGNPFGFAIVALTAAPAVSTGFTGTVKVELVDGTNSATSCSALPLVQPLANQTFTSADGGRITVSNVSQANAWKNVRVRISHPATAPTIISCSTDPFAIRPNGLAVTVTDANPETAGTARTLNNTAVPGGVVHKAGRFFTVRAAAQNAAGAITTNYAGSLVATASQCAATGGVCPPSLGMLDFGSVTAGAGVLTTDTASYSEAGAFSLLLQDRTFSDVDASDGSTAAERYISSAATTVGRFVPDHFAVSAVTITPRTDIAACSTSSFTYMGEPFSARYTLTARNAANATVSNYAGALATLSPANPSHLQLAAVDASSNLTATVSGVTSSGPARVTTAAAHGLATGNRVYLSGVLGMNGVNNALYAVTVVDANNFTIGIDTSASGSYQSGGTVSRLSVASSIGSWASGTAEVTSTLALQRAVQPDGPFSALQVGIAPRDPDGVTLPAGMLDLDADKSGSSERFRLGGMPARFGRLRLSNAHGSELLNLPVPMQLQFWNGSFFQTNADDSCSSIAPASIRLVNHLGGISASNMTTGGNVGIANPVAGGIGRLTLAKPSPLPSPRQKGSVDVTVDLLSENKPYLQGKWAGAAYDRDPRARATFGIYKGGPVIYLREMY